MKSGWNKLIIGFAAFIVMVFVPGIKVQADAANVTISSADGTKGDTVTVTVSVSSDVSAMAEVWITYDTKYLEFVDDGTHGGTAGYVQTILTDLPANQPQNINLSFILKEVGSTSISVAPNTNISDINKDPENAKVNTSTSNGTITINATDAAANDSRLSGLIVSGVTPTGASYNVNYAPSFSSETYDYTATVPSNVTRIVVSTTLSDSKATTQVSGTKIDVGDNKTTIVVTAEDGSQSTYTLYITREAENQTTTAGQQSADPNQPTDPQAETSSETTSETTSETVTELDRTPKLVEAMGKYIIQDFSLVAKPEGYEEAIASYEGQNIAVLKGVTRNITLVCMADDPEGTNGTFYIFNEATGAIDKFVNFKTSEKEYTVIPTDDNYEGPKDYIQTTIDINGESVKAWIREEGSEFYVIYAMNENGDTALYVYDTKEKTLQRYVEGIKTIEIEEEPETENTEYLAMKRQYNELNEEYQNVKNKKNRFIKMLITTVIALAFIAMIAVYKYLAEKERQIHENKNEINDWDKEIKTNSENHVVCLNPARTANQAGDSNNVVESVLETQPLHPVSQLSDMSNNSVSSNPDTILSTNADTTPLDKDGTAESGNNSAIAEPGNNSILNENEKAKKDIEDLLFGLSDEHDKQ